MDPMQVLAQLQGSPTPSRATEMHTPHSSTSSMTGGLMPPTSTQPSNKTPDAVQRALDNPVTAIEHAMQTAVISQNVLTASGGNTMASTTSYAQKPSPPRDDSFAGAGTLASTAKPNKEVDPASLNFFGDLLAGQPLQKAGS